MTLLLAVIVMVAGTQGATPAPEPPKAPVIFKKWCPFEYGCHFGRWVSHSVVKAYRERGTRSPVAFELHEGEEFNALGADMVVEQVGIARILKPYDVLRPGEKILIYAYSGEGDYGVWVRGQMTSYTCFWDEQEGEASNAVLERPPEMTWWVRITTKKGQIGWLGLRNLERSCGIAFAEDIDMGRER